MTHCPPTHRYHSPERVVGAAVSGDPRTRLLQMMLAQLTPPHTSHLPTPPLTRGLTDSAVDRHPHHPDFSKALTEVFVASHVHDTTSGHSPFPFPFPSRLPFSSREMTPPMILS